MSRKNYVAIAAAIKTARVNADNCTDGDRKQTAIVTINTVIDELVGVMIDDNPRFDAARFRTACGQ